MWKEVFLFAAVVATATAELSRVEQMHLSFTEHSDEIRATWVRVKTAISEAPADEACFYGTSSSALSNKVAASVHTHTDGGFLGSIYTAVMQTPTPSTTYYYQCGSTQAGSVSPVFAFRTAPAEMSEETVHAAAFGDMGASKAGVGSLIGRDSSFTQHMMNEETIQGAFDFVINVGDSSYANDVGRIVGHIGNNSFVYDSYFNEIEDTIARAPMMLVVGNHEAEYHFAPILNRTFNPVLSSGPLSRFYSEWTYGPIHVIGISTEHSLAVGGEQYNFVEAALARVNRTLTPWVMVIGHRPIYCSDMMLMKSRCGPEALVYREPMEPLFHKYNVDVYMAGHNHMFERSYPTYNKTRVSKSFDNPKATVYIVNGAAGDMEGTEPWGSTFDKIHAFSERGFDTGFMRLHINRTAIVFEYADSVKKSLVDSFTMTKTEHIPWE